MKKDNFFKKILKTIVNVYNNYYAIFNVVISLFLLSSFNNKILMFTLIGIDIFECVSWYKNVFKHFGTKSELFGNIRQNNSMCIYGGIGSGKSTMAEYIIHKLVPSDRIYYNTKRDGYLAFTNEHLLLKKKLLDGCGVIVDESGGQVDSYHYSNKDNTTRKRIDYLNKFFRQWYTDKAFLIYIDQCQSNQNTSLYKNIYYVLQLTGVEVKPSGIIPHFITSIVLKIINKFSHKKINNPFSLVALNYMEFNKLGDYAEHYNVIIKDKDRKKLVGSIYQFFGGFDTYVFKEFNPAEEDKNPYIWGFDAKKDKLIMENNFALGEFEQDFKSSFLQDNNVVKK